MKHHGRDGSGAPDMSGGGIHWLFLLSPQFIPTSQIASLLTSRIQTFHGLRAAFIAEDYLVLLRQLRLWWLELVIV